MGLRKDQRRRTMQECEEIVERKHSSGIKRDNDDVTTMGGVYVITHGGN